MAAPPWPAPIRPTGTSRAGTDRAGGDQPAGRTWRRVLARGSFDIIHEGHSMYLEAARRFGDFLIVGLDSDAKIRARKGPHRPAVPEIERLRMVTHQRGVGLVTLKDLHHERWALIKAA